LQIFVVRMGAKDDRKFLIGIRPKNIAVKMCAIGHLNFYISIDDDVISSLRRGPRTGEHKVGLLTQGSSITPAAHECLATLTLV